MNTRGEHRRFPHRGGLTEHVASLTPDPSLIERAGGSELIERVIETFYVDGVLQDPILQPVFIQNYDRRLAKDFFVEWMGGEPRYSRSPARWRGLGRTHAQFFITPPLADRWLFHMKAALDRCGVPEAPVNEIIAKLTHLVRRLVNNKHTVSYMDDLIGHGKSIQSEDFWHFEALRLGVRAGDLDALRGALIRHPDVARRRGSHGRTLLWEAALAGHLDLVQVLLDSGAPVDTPGCAPIDTDFLQPLTNEPGPPVMCSPYALARSSGHHHVAARLLEHGAVVDIFTAAHVGDQHRLDALIKNDPELVHVEDPADDFHRITALHHAVAGGHVATTRYLIDHGANVQPYSMWLLTFAALQANLSLVRLLLEHGADARQSLCMGPLDTDTRPITDLLITYGADIDKHPAHGSLLHHLCRHGNDPIMLRRIRALIDHGADVNALNARAELPLHAALRCGSLELIKTLLQAGAYANGVAGQRDPPIFACRASRSARAHDSQAIDCLDVLLRHGVNLASRNRGDETILFHFVRQGDTDTVSWLLDHGADPDTRNARGHSAHDMAHRSRKARAASIARLLTGHR